MILPIPLVIIIIWVLIIFKKFILYSIPDISLVFKIKINNVKDVNNNINITYTNEVTISYSFKTEISLGSVFILVINSLKLTKDK